MQSPVKSVQLDLKASLVVTSGTSEMAGGLGWSLSPS